MIGSSLTFIGPKQVGLFIQVLNTSIFPLLPAACVVTISHMRGVHYALRSMRLIP